MVANVDYTFIVTALNHDYSYNRYILICTHFPCLKRTVAKIKREI